MSTSRNIFHILDGLNIDQKVFAESIGVSKAVVSKWRETSKEHSSSYNKYLVRIANYFNLPLDYFLGTGIFEDWEYVLAYPWETFNALRTLIPSGVFDRNVSDEVFLDAWLDKRLCYGITINDEIALIRWFSSAVTELVFSPDPAGRREDPTVSITLSPAYQTFLAGQQALLPPVPVAKTMEELLNEFFKRHQRDGTLIPVDLSLAEANMVKLYRLASADDRLIIDTLLKKYQSPLAEQTSEAV